MIVRAAGNATIPDVELLTTLILFKDVRGISVELVILLLLVSVVAVLDGIGSPNVVTFTVFLTLLLAPTFDV